MTTSGTTRLLLGAIMTLTLASGAEAQLPGLIKKKVTEAVKGPEKTTAKPADAEKKSIYNQDVLEMTQPVLDGFARGLQTEIALRDEFRKVLEKLKTPDQYKACTDDAAASPAGQKISSRILNLPESISAEEMQRVMMKAGQDLAALQESKCGKDPSVEWPNEKRAEKLKEFERKGAEAAGPESPPARDLDPAEAEGISGPSDYSEALPSLWALHRVTGLGPAPVAMFGITERAYAILKERTIAFCMDAAIRSRNTYESKVDLSVVQVPGQGKDVYYVYSSQEAKDLWKNCERLMNLTKKLAAFAWEQATKK